MSDLRNVTMQQDNADVSNTDSHPHSGERRKSLIIEIRGLKVVTRAELILGNQAEAPSVEARQSRGQ